MPALPGSRFATGDRGDWRPPGRQDAGAPSASLRDEEGPPRESTAVIG
jgi:hypothetical protein